MIKKFKILSVIFTLLLLFLLNSNVYAIEGNAASLYHSELSVHATNARDAYVRAGYTCTLINAPSYIVTRSNLIAASVIQLAGHGNRLYINLGNSGVTIDPSRYPDAVEANLMNWTNYNTKLITYLGCHTSGDGYEDSNSIAAVTARNGVQVVVGFKDNFNIPSGKAWSQRYNDHLAAGYGVYDSLLEANNHLYLNPNVKSGVVWHHGNYNLTITLNNAQQIASNININASDDKNILPVEKQNIINSDIDNITTQISNYYPNFNINNYEIIHNTTSMVNVDTGETTEVEYTDFMLKIGDFITTAGFTVRSMNNKIVQIIDNNIDIEKQEEALKHPELFVANEDNSNLNNMKNSAITQMKSKYPNTLIENNIEYKYYYDIELDKKYIVYEIPSVINTSQSEKSVLYDTIKFEV